LKKLSKHMGQDVNPKTGIITLKAIGKSPQEAEAILNAQLKALSTFAIEKRESQARNERLFAERRLDELKGKYKSLVGEITRFYEQNRNPTLSPRLRFQEQDLQSELSLWQDLVQNVAREGELARLDEVRDIPAVTVLEHPYASPIKTFPRRSFWAALGLLIGVIIGLRPDQLIRRRTLGEGSLSAESQARALSNFP
jgi:hypothetical protein